MPGHPVEDRQPGELAAGAGGLLLAAGALETFVAGLVQLTDAR